MSCMGWDGSATSWQRGYTLSVMTLRAERQREGISALGPPHNYGSSPEGLFSGVPTWTMTERGNALPATSMALFSLSAIWMIPV